MTRLGPELLLPVCIIVSRQSFPNTNDETIHHYNIQVEYHGQKEATFTIMDWSSICYSDKTQLHSAVQPVSPLSGQLQAIENEKNIQIKLTLSGKLTLISEDTNPGNPSVRN